MKNLIVIFLVVVILASTSYSQWNVVREANQPGGRHSYLSLSSTDGNIIYTCGAMQGSSNEYVIERSTDGGLTWERQNTSSFPATSASVNDMLYGIATLDGVNALVVGDSGLIASTSNGGASWTVRNSGSRFKLFDVAFSEKAAVVAGNYGTMGISYDSGTTWKFTELIDSTTFINCQVFGNDTIYLIDRFYRNFFRSFDAGLTWDSVHFYPTYFNGNEGAQVYDAYFWNSREGLIVGINKEATAGYQVYNNFIARTTDAGTTWQVVLDTVLPFTNGIQRVHFKDRLNGIAGSRSSKFLLTSDGGLSWIEDSIEVGEALRGAFDVLAINDAYLLCAANILNSGMIARYVPEEGDVEVPGFTETVSVYPNPTHSFITITPTKQKAKVIILDNLGRTLYSELASEGNLQIDVQPFPTGMYFVLLADNNGKTVAVSFIKE